MNIDTTMVFPVAQNTSNGTGLSVPENEEKSLDVMVICQSIIASVGILANMTVVVVLLNQRKLRCKIPNLFIINQVRGNHII